MILFAKVKNGPRSTVSNVPDSRSRIASSSHTLVDIYQEIIATAILLHSADSIRVVVSYKQRCVHKVLVNSLLKLAKEKNAVR